MSSTLVRGRYVVTKVKDDASSEVIDDGAVFQRDGEIVDVGGYETLKTRYSPDDEIGSPNQVVIPGLINAHHHIGLTPFQLGVPDLPLELWTPARLAARDVEPYLDTIYCAMQMIESGITTVMHNHGLYRMPLGYTTLDVGNRILRAYQESGLGTDDLDRRLPGRNPNARRSGPDPFWRR